MSNGQRSVMVPPHFDDFIDAQIATGRFNDASEVVRAGLRLLEREEASLAELRKMIDEADLQIANGEGIVVSSSKDFSESIIVRGMQTFNREN